MTSSSNLSEYSSVTTQTDDSLPANDSHKSEYSSVATQTDNALPTEDSTTAQSSLPQLGLGTVNICTTYIHTPTKTNPRYAVKLRRMEYGTEVVGMTQEEIDITNAMFRGAFRDLKAAVDADGSAPIETVHDILRSVFKKYRESDIIPSYISVLHVSQEDMEALINSTILDHEGRSAREKYARLYSRDVFYR